MLSKIQLFSSERSPMHSNWSGSTYRRYSDVKVSSAFER